MIALFTGVIAFYLSYNELKKSMILSKDEIKILQFAFSQSQHYKTSGGKTKYYFDLDRYIEKEKIQIVLEWYTNFINEVESECGKIDKLVFIEKNRGPIGALSFKSLITLKTGIPSVTVRLKKRVLLNAVKSDTPCLNKIVPIKNGEKVLIISDVSTSGTTILNTIEIIKLFNAEVLGAIVILCRDDEIKEKLEKKNFIFKYKIDSSFLEDLDVLEDKCA